MRTLSPNVLHCVALGCNGMQHAVAELVAALEEDRGPLRPKGRLRCGRLRCAEAGVVPSGTA